MPGTPQQIKDLGLATLSKAADKFVDFIITKYTGKSIRVFQAEGDVEADKVKSRWEQIEKPFWLQAEATKMNRQYSNLGSTLIKAAPLISSSENKILDDNDVFWGLLEHSKDISNEEMQKLIAKIIAGEYNVPGTYSMSALQTIKMLGKKELELFENVCSLVINGDQVPREIFSFNTENGSNLMKEIEIDFGSLQTLQSLGLFLPNNMNVSFDNPGKSSFVVTYFERKIEFESIGDGVTKINTQDFYGLSEVGKQILKHLNPRYNKNYFLWLVKNYRISHLKIREDIIGS